MSNSVEQAIWRRRDENDCLWADCGDASVLYHIPSGRTHLVNQATRQVLELLEVEALSTADVAAALQLDAPDPYLLQISSMMSRLEELGLLERD